MFGAERMELQREWNCFARAFTPGALSLQVGYLQQFLPMTRIESPRSWLMTYWTLNLSKVL